MKKFCSKCGYQLKLGIKTCTNCHVFNPYFIAGYIGITDADIENKPIAPPNDTQQPQQIKKGQETSDLQNELLRVKNANEQHKKETLDLVKSVQKELQDIDKENKLLKQTVESLKNYQPLQNQPWPNATQLNENKSLNANRSFAAAVILLFIVAGCSYLFFSRSNVKIPVNAASPVTMPQRSETAKSQIAAFNKTDTSHEHKLLAIATAAPPKPNPTANVNPSVMPFSLTTTRAVNDLIGKKLSGCDITINNKAEVEHIDNLLLVEKLSASYLKYKCTLKIKQGNDLYTSTPYIYYSAEGTFIKVDGTNCE